MGVPVVTLSGNRFAGRMGASLLTHLDLADLVAHDAEQYISIAAGLAEDRARLSQLRLGLRHRVRQSVLNDAHRFTRQLEEAYRWMRGRWCERQMATTRDSLDSSV
jgi:predicted O-linked N-acetylglucosamine transferase (SPINDLY family)